MTSKGRQDGPDAAILAPVRMSTLSMTRRDSFDLWASVLSEAYDVLPNAEVPSLRNEMAVWSVEDAVYSAFQGESAFLRRTRLHTQLSLGGHVKIRRILSGRMRLDDGQNV